MSCPCRGCEERTPACHDACKKYGEWKKEREAVKNYNREQNRVLICEKSIRKHWQRMRYCRKRQPNIQAEGRK